MLKYFMIISFGFTLAKCSLEFGEFEVNVTKMEIFKGPKRRDCVESKTTIVNYTILDMDFDVKEDMKIVKGKITGYLNDKALMRLPLKNACDHIFLKPLLQSLFKNPNHCGIEKGHYRFNVDIPTITQNFYGGKFFYGNWRFRWIFYNDFCNLHCGEMYISMTPKAISVVYK